MITLLLWVDYDIVVLALLLEKVLFISAKESNVYISQQITMYILQ